MLRLLSRLRPQTLTPFRSPSPLLSSSFSSKGRRAGAAADAPDDDDDDAAGVAVSLFGRDPSTPPHLIVIQPRMRPEARLNSKLSEALNLANSLEEHREGYYREEFASKSTPPHLIVQNPAQRGGIRADKYFGKGTVEDIKIQIRAMETEKAIDAVFVNATLSGIQQRNLEVSWGKPVLDRVGLIIEIFNAHAETKEAKLQAELAALMYKKSRLVRARGPGGKLTFGTSGEAEVVSARGRGGGGQGFVSGAGETELQLQKRRILDRRIRLLSEIEAVRRTRALQRSSRRRRGGSPGHGLTTVAVVGYTNAGKSTLVSALSQTDLYSDDRLFATVDPRLRSVILPSGRKILLSDTVGFISDLPVQLVEAFHATLEETVEADMLVHVLDSSAPNLKEQRSTVLEVLKQIGVSDQKMENMIEVWNKIDLLEKDKADDIVDEDKSLDEGDNAENEDADESVDEDKCIVESQDEYYMSSSEVESFTVPEMPSPDEASSDMELAQEEDLRTIDYQPIEHTEVSVTTNTAAPCESTDAQALRTSAVMGVGLQELLYLIDEKLNILNSPGKENVGIFDRKWRPSYTADDEKVAKQ